MLLVQALEIFPAQRRLVGQGKEESLAGFRDQAEALFLSA
jgi:hypothetical protein